MDFLITCIYVGIVFIRPSEVIGFLRIVPLFEIFTLILFVMFLVKRPPVFRMPQSKMLWLFSFTVIISNVMVGWFGGAVIAFETMLRTLIFYFAIIATVNTEERLIKLIKLLTIICFLLAVNAIYQYNNGVGLGGIEPVFDLSKNRWRVRYSGLLNDPNDFGMIQIMFLPFLIQRILANVSFFKKFLNFLIVLLMTGCIYLTFSRGSYLGTVIVCMMSVAVKKKKIIHVIFFLGLLLAVSTLIPGVSNLMGTASVEEESAGGRVLAWEVGLEIFKMHPIFGAGYGRFTEYHNFTAHNSYVLAFAETGLVGLFFWFGIIYFSIIPLLKESLLLDTDDANKYYNIQGILVSLIAVLSVIFFLSRTYVLPVYLLFSLSQSCQQIYKLGYEKMLKKDLLRILVMSLGFIFFMYLFVKFGLRG